MQADLYIRGGSFDQTLLLIDGIKVEDPQTGHHTMNMTLPLETNVVLIGFDKLASLDEMLKLIFTFDIEAIEFFTMNAVLKVKEEFDQINIEHLKNNYYLIIELSTQDGFMKALEKIYKDKLAHEVIVSSNENQKHSIWQYRLLISESISRRNPIKLDIAVPVKNIIKLNNELELFFKKDSADNLVLFGHLGDGNLHVNILPDKNNFKYDEKPVIENKIHTIVSNLDGTFSAEHGIGANKVKTFMKHADKAKLDIIKNLKNHFDENKILNPGKLVK